MIEQPYNKQILLKMPQVNFIINLKIALANSFYAHMLTWSSRFGIYHKEEGKGKT